MWQCYEWWFCEIQFLLLNFPWEESLLAKKCSIEYFSLKMYYLLSKLRMFFYRRSPPWFSLKCIIGVPALGRLNVSENFQFLIVIIPLMILFYHRSGEWEKNFLINWEKTTLKRIKYLPPKMTFLRIISYVILLVSEGTVYSKIFTRNWFIKK